MSLAKILVAEDNDNDFFLLERAFLRAEVPARLWRARDGVEAKQHLAALDREAYPVPDLVLADIKMPRCNGLELLAALRGEPSTAGLPVILLSAKAQVADVQRGLELGADDYVTKPFDPLELIDRVYKVLAKSRR